MDLIAVNAMGWLISYPLTRFQTYTQTRFTYPEAPKLGLGNLSNFYKGGAPNLIKSLPMSPLFCLALYPLEVMQIQAAAAGGKQLYDFKNLTSRPTNVSNWHGFSAYLLTLGCYLGVYALGPFTYLLVIPIDNIRRNYVCQKLEGNSLSYSELFNQMKKGGIGNFYRGWYLYPQILLASFVSRAYRKSETPAVSH